MTNNSEEIYRKIQNLVQWETEEALDNFAQNMDFNAITQQKSKAEIPRKINAMERIRISFNLYFFLINR